MAAPRRHEGDGRGAEGTRRFQEPAGTGPQFHEGDGRGAEGTCRSQEPAGTGPQSHEGDGCGSVGIAGRPAGGVHYHAARTSKGSRTSTTFRVVTGLVLLIVAAV